MTPLRFILISIYGGFALFGVLLVFAFMTGSTFGQRCAKLHEWNSQGWHHCVELFTKRADK